MKASLDVWRRLLGVAYRFIESTGLRISVPGRVYLAFFLWQAARRVVRDGNHTDEYTLSQADQAVEMVLTTASGVAETGPSAAPGLGLFFAVSPTKLTARALRRAKRLFCPGFPPIC